jgi:hypothetical protein
VAIALYASCLVLSLLQPTDATGVFQGSALPLALLVFLAAIAAAWSGWLQVPAKVSWAVATPLLAGLLFLLLSTLTADYRANGRAAWNSCWHLLAAGLFTLLSCSLCRHPALRRSITACVLAAAVGLAAYAAYQVLWSNPAARAEFERDPDSVLRANGLDAPEGSPLREAFKNRLYSPEPTGTFALANSLAALLSLALVVGTGVLLQTLPTTPRGTAEAVVPPQPRRAWLPSLALVAVLLLVAVAWVLTKSRTAYLATLLIAVAWAAQAAWKRGRVRTAGSLNSSLRNSEAHSTGQGRAGGPSRLAPVIALLVASVALAGVLGLLASDDLVLKEAPKSVLYRFEYWRATARMILDHPWTGVGLGNFQSYYTRYKLPQASEIIADPHNWLFDIAATCSLPFLLATLGGLAAAVHAAWRNVAGAGNAEVLSKAHAPAAMRPFWISCLVAWPLLALVLAVLGVGGDLIAMLVSFLFAALTVACLWRWLDADQARPAPIAFWGAMTLLVCLLATGSWQASGLLFPWLALMSVACTSPVERAASAVSGGVQHKLLLGGVCLLALGFLLHTWLPVMNAWGYSQQAIYLARAVDEAVEWTEQAIATDPRDPQYYLQLLQIQARRGDVVSAAARETQLAAVQSATARLLACDPSNSQHWRHAGEEWLVLAAATPPQSQQAPPRMPRLLEPQLPTTPDTATPDTATPDTATPDTATPDTATPDTATPDTAVTGELSGDEPTVWPAGTPSDERPEASLLKSAAGYFEQAWERYPTSVELAAQVALARLLAGDIAAAGTAARQARALSDATPHIDRQLAAQILWLPVGLETPPAATVRSAAQAPWIKAKPLCDWLLQQIPEPGSVPATTRLAP